MAGGGGPPPPPARRLCRPPSSHPLCPILSLFHPLPLPIQILAGDVAGIVVEADPDSPFPPGTPVFAMTDGFKWDCAAHGCWAEYVSFPAAWAARAPAAIPLGDAAALPLVALTAYQTLALAPNLKRAGAPGADAQHILVHAGAGGVGHVGVQLARAVFGAAVTATAGPANQAFLKEELGVAEAVDYTATSPAALVASHGGCFDAILDVIGGPAGEATAAALLKPGGTYCHVFNTATDAASSKKSEVEAAGKHYVGPTLVSPDGPAMAELARLVDAGALKPVISSRVGLDGVAGAMEAVEAGHVRGKIVVDVSKE